MRYLMVGALAAFVVFPAAAHAQEPEPGLGHFKCYQILGNPVDRHVKTQDQFDIKEDGRFDDTSVRRAVRLCNPVAKGHRGRIFDIPDRLAHLTFYVTAPTNFAEQRVVAIANQFGRAKIRTYSAPILATPTDKNGEGFPEGLDHYKCYRAYGRPANTVVSLRDQFAFQLRAQVGAPVLFCNPTRKIDEAGVAFGVKNADDHLTCYQISQQPFEKSAVTSDQFGRQELRVLSADLLCAPTKKLAWERVQ